MNTLSFTTSGVVGFEVDLVTILKAIGKMIHFLSELLPDWLIILCVSICSFSFSYAITNKIIALFKKKY